MSCLYYESRLMVARIRQTLLPRALSNLLTMTILYSLEPKRASHREDMSWPMAAAGRKAGSYRPRYMRGTLHANSLLPKAILQY